MRRAGTQGPQSIPWVPDLLLASGTTWAVYLKLNPSNSPDVRQASMYLKKAVAPWG
jgi:hypothetical protein